MVVDRTVPAQFWPEYRNSLLSVIDSLPVGSDIYHISIMSASNDVRLYYYFDLPQSKNLINDAINRIVPSGGGSMDMSKSLGFLSQLIGTSGFGTRNDVPLFVLIWTYRHTLERDSIIYANNIKASPATISVVGLTSQVDYNMLTQIASSDSNFVQVNQFSELNSYVPVITSLLLSATDPPTQSPSSTTPFPVVSPIDPG